MQVNNNQYLLKIDFCTVYYTVNVALCAHQCTSWHNLVLDSMTGVGKSLAWEIRGFQDFVLASTSWVIPQVEAWKIFYSDSLWDVNTRGAFQFDRAPDFGLSTVVRLMGNTFSVFPPIFSFILPQILTRCPFPATWNCMTFPKLA